MDIQSILVSLEPRIAPTTLGAAVDIARRFRATLTGFAAAEPSPVLLEGPAGIDQYVAARGEIEEALSLAKADFEARVPHDLVRSFISSIENPPRRYGASRLPVTCWSFKPARACPTTALTPISASWF